jgi:hypothetical protein
MLSHSYMLVTLQDICHRLEVKNEPKRRLSIQIDYSEGGNSVLFSAGTSSKTTVKKLNITSIFTLLTVLTLTHFQ